jgi:hypothetical protein
VFQDFSNAGGTSGTSGIETTTDFSVLIENFGPGDRIYVDDPFNNLSKVNNNGLAFGLGNGSTANPSFWGLSGGNGNPEIFLDLEANLVASGASLAKLNLALNLSGPNKSALIGDGGLVFLLPTLVGSSPADNATGVASSANLVLTFSEPVKLGEGFIKIVNPSTGTDTRTINVGNATDRQQLTVVGNVLTINPTQDLLAGVSYDVLIEPDAIVDLTDNPFEGINILGVLNFTVTN